MRFGEDCEVTSRKGGGAERLDVRLRTLGSQLEADELADRFGLLGV